MCGITGGVGLSAQTEELLDAQLKTLEHRGPDESGTYLAEGISLGIRRLSIVQIATGKQPATDSNNSVHVVFNGEIYNYRELRAELAKSHFNFGSSSETEVIIELYMKFGIDFVSRLNGMFAIAIYDSRDKTLHLIRDRLGKKPLWISHSNDGTLFFASEVKAISLARADLTFRTESVFEVMQYGFVTPPFSTFHEIQQLPPASILTWNNGKTVYSRYWNPNFDTNADITFPEALETTLNLIKSAVARRLVSERPVGAFLSGGYDSTLVTSLMVQLMSNTVETYTIGFENKDYDESSHARKVANFLGTNHHEEIVKPNPSLIIEEISKVLDQPFADSSFIPTYLLAKFASNNSIVVLGGDGGDEVFGGYDRYLAVPVLQTLNPLLPIIKYLLKVGEIMNLFSERKFRRLKAQLHSESSLAERYNSVLSLSTNFDLKRVMNPKFNGLGSETDFINNFNEGQLSDLNRMTRSDLGFYLPGDILFKADMATMAHGIELRSPLLDISVIEWALTLPSNFKVRGFETKFLLKEVVRTLVPNRLINRPKMGFGVPIANWLRSEMREMVIDILMDKTSTNRGWFDSIEVKKLLEDHFKGKDNSRIIWPMLMLELWARNWLN